MVKININIQKKDLWLISAIAVFLVGVGFVIAYDWDYPGASEAGLPAIHGHTANELFNVSGGGGGMSFGNWADLTPQIVLNNVSDIASSDGIVIAFADGLPQLRGYTPIGTIRAADFSSGTAQSITMPVKSGDSWIVAGISGVDYTQRGVYWLPIVSGGSGASYDSGWFSVNGNTAYTKIHNLGTTTLQITVFAASDGGGSPDLSTVHAMSQFDDINIVAGGQVYGIDNNQLIIRTRTYPIMYPQTGDDWETTGYYRVLATAIS